MTSDGPADRAQGLSLEMVHWHLTREDHLRAALATRVGAVLSTNALVIAGTTLAFSMRGSQRLHTAVLVTAIGALCFAAASVVCASMALNMLWRTDLRAHGPRSDGGAVYNYTRIGDKWSTFESFRKTVGELSREQQLRGAVDELWRASQLHLYRYRKLRAALWLLLVGITFLLVTIGLAAVIYNR